MSKKYASKSLNEYQYIPLNDHLNYIYVSDLGTAASLIIMGFELTSLDKSNPRKVLFIFQREDGIYNITNAYLINHLEVKAREFFDTMKALKNRIYSE